jgi:hypothetical protein
MRSVIDQAPNTFVLKGFPTVNLAGQGSPDRNKTLNVTPQGKEGRCSRQSGGP